ncbi:MAG: glycosyltransferase [Magnetococcus sp. DMHC-1]|nr:glycosyltransferase [Magnetococcales bacterium]
MKISVCILCYNHEKYIGDCLSSVVGQQVQADLEVFVGDDCSSDRSREIIADYAQKFPDLIYPVFQEKNIGSTKNYQSLIRRTTGDFIAFMDGDDFWFPGKLAYQLDFLGLNEECVAVYTNAIVISDSGELSGKFNGNIPPRFDLDFLVKEGDFLNASSVMYRNRCKSSFLQTDILFDYHRNILLASHGTIGYISRSLVAYRHSLTSIQLREPKKVKELYWKSVMLAEKAGANRQILRQYMVKYLKSVFFNAIINKDWNQFRNWQRKVDESGLSQAYILLSMVANAPMFYLKLLWKIIRNRLCNCSVMVFYNR